MKQKKLLSLTIAVGAFMLGYSAEAGYFRNVAEIVPSGFAKSVAKGSDITGLRWLNNSASQAQKSGTSALKSGQNVVQGVYVAGTTAINLALRIGFGSDAIADLKANRVGLWITGKDASQNLFTGIAATASHGGMAVFKSAEFAARASASVLSGVGAAATQIFKASLYAADAVVQLGKEYVLKPTHDLFTNLYKFSKELVVRLGYGTAGLVTGLASKPVGMLGGLLNGLIPNSGNGLENAAQKMGKSAKKNLVRSVN